MCKVAIAAVPTTTYGQLLLHLHIPRHGHVLINRQVFARLRQVIAWLRLGWA